MPESPTCPATSTRFVAAGCCLALFGLLTLSGCSRTDGESARWRETALAGLEWLAAAAVPGPAGSLYPDVPGDSLGIPTNPDLYHGQAGRVFGLLQAAAALGDDLWRERALAAMNALEALTGTARSTGVPGAGLYTGLAGSGAALLAGARLFPDQPRFAEAGLALADEILDSVRPAGTGATWSGGSDIISGTAGTGLFLLEAWRFSSRERYLDGAREAADWLLSVAQRREDMLFWPVGGATGMHYPNFAHGTSGVCFFLGELATALGSEVENYLTARRAGLAWLTAHGSAGGSVVFHHEEGGEDLQYVGWCHGPAGTARAFLQERALPGSPAGAPVPAPALAGADWLVTEVGAEPGESPSGYWNNVSVCCGTSGILLAMLDVYLETGQERYLEHARACGRVLCRWAVTEGAGVKWPQAEHRVRPDFIQAQTGYMQGAAGIAAALLRLWLVETGHPERFVRLPDEYRGTPGRGTGEGS